MAIWMIPFLLFMFIFGCPNWGSTDSIKSIHIDVNRETTVKKDENKSSLQKKKSVIEPTPSSVEHGFFMDQVRSQLNFINLLEKKRTPFTDFLEKLISSSSSGHWGCKDNIFRGVAEAKSSVPVTHLSNEKFHLRGEDAKEKKHPKYLNISNPRKNHYRKRYLWDFVFLSIHRMGVCFWEYISLLPLKQTLAFSSPFKKRFTMYKETFNILVLGDQTFRTRSFRIRKERFIVLLSLLILFQLAVTLCFFDYLQVKKKIVFLNRLHQELQIQNFQIQQFSLKIKDLDEKILKLKHLDKKIRTMANLERGQNVVPLIGMGGFPPSEVKKKLNEEPKGEE